MVHRESIAEAVVGLDVFNIGVAWVTSGKLKATVSRLSLDLKRKAGVLNDRLRNLFFMLLFDSSSRDWLVFYD